MRNRLYNCLNPYQGNFKRVLAVCSAGLLRSPTVAWVLSQDPYNYNTRACGVHSYALIPLDQVLLTWAQEIVCLQQEHASIVVHQLEEHRLERPVITLNIPDDYQYRSPELITLIKQKYSGG